jgi:hypothetical protein
MKSVITKIKLVALLAVFSIPVFAQEQMSEFLRAGTSDGSKVLGAYASPLLKSFGVYSNAGWFNTAKVHGLGGFSLNIYSNVALAPSEDKTFDVSTLGLSSNTKVINGQNISQTIFGDNTSKNNPQIGMYSRYPGATQDSMLTSFKLPEGLGFSFLPLPAAQFSVGVGLGTEVSVRYLPTLKSSGFELGMIGFGVKHDVKQWIPGIKLLPFDLSVMGGYTKFDAIAKLAEVKGDAPSSTIDNPNPNKTYSQTAEFASTAYTFNVLISKKLAFFTPYLGLGYQGSTTELAMKGEYPVTEINTNYNPSDPTSKPKVVRELKDPVKVEGKLDGFRATAGFRLKFTLFTLHADYTYANYSVASLGIGLNVQSLAPPKL